MKKLLMALMISYSAFAASVTVPKFEIKFLIDDSLYDISFKLTLACRYEKFVISDSAQYHYEFQDVEFDFKKKKLASGLTEVRFINSRVQKLEMRRPYFADKECQTMEKFYISSKKYRSGYGSVDKPRKITLGVFNHSRFAEFKTFEVEHYRNLFEGKELSFIMEPGYRTYFAFALDGEIFDRMSFYARIHVPNDPDTGLPYEL